MEVDVDGGDVGEDEALGEELEGGGSEVYVERIAMALAAAGDDVTIFCALACSG